MNSRVKRNASIDYLKIFCAIIVVYLHTVNLSGDIHGPQILLRLFSFAVWAVCPVEVFLLITGIFYFRSAFDYETNRFTKNHEIRLFHYIKLYFLWSLLYVPNLILRLIELGQEGKSLVYVLLLLVKRVFFTGTTGILWYMLGIIYGIVLLKFLLSKFKDYQVGIISLLLYLISLLGGSYYHFLDFIPLIKNIVDSAQQFTGHFYLMRVPAFLMIGYYFNKCNLINRAKSYNRILIIFLYVCSVLCIFAERMLCYYFELGNSYPNFFCCLVTPTLLFLVTISFSKESSLVSSFLGDCSSTIYFTHWQVRTIYEYFYNSTGWECMFLCIIIPVVIHIVALQKKPISRN